MISLILSVLIFSASPLADEKDGTVYVDLNPNVYNPKDFPTKKGAKIRSMKKETSKNKMPTKIARDAIFSKVSGLDKYLESMDQFAKDSLYIHARTNDAKDLEKLYPNIPSKTLASLKDEIKKTK